MSSLTSNSLSSTVADQITSTLLPTDTTDNSNSLAIILAFSIVFILAPVTISGNTMILAAFYRYKRLRTASNCLLASLAVSDFGVGVFMPFGVHLEMSGVPESGVTSLCIVPYCIVIALCSVSVLITVAIAVDRLTSLAQPLRYKNIITHSSVEKYIAVFWIYAIAVGLSPLVYMQIMGSTQTSENCRFRAAVQPPVRVFLVIAVWAPSALVLLGCYIYVYLVARAHARAIYTVELSFRHQTQTLALPRYGQALALTVGAFLLFWLPFQACMLLDIFCGTKILSEWSVVWLGLPILAHSGVNPWIYAFHHGEMRIAAGKIAEDVVTLFGIHPSRYGCSSVARSGRGGCGVGSNLELAEVNNKSNEDERPPIEDYFAEKHHLYSREYHVEPVNNNNNNNNINNTSTSSSNNNNVDISPEGNDCGKRFSHYESIGDIIEEDVHDLAKMLGPEYIINRAHIIDSNQSVDKRKNVKYMLDPNFNRIRHLSCLRQKSSPSSSSSLTNTLNTHSHLLFDKSINQTNKNTYTSYSHLKSHINNCKTNLKLNALSDPMLNAKKPQSNGSIDYEDDDDDDDDDVDDGFNRGKKVDDTNEKLSRCARDGLKLDQRRDSGLASMSDPNIKSINTCKSHCHHENVISSSDCSNSYFIHTFDYSKYQLCHCHNTPKNFSYKLDKKIRKDINNKNFNKNRNRIKSRSDIISKWKQASKQLTLTANKLSQFFHQDNSKQLKLKNHLNDYNLLRKNNIEDIKYLNKKVLIRHSESINEIKKSVCSKFLKPEQIMDSLTVPTIHSEPPSPIDPIPLISLPNGGLNNHDDDDDDDVDCDFNIKFIETRKIYCKSPVRHSDPIPNHVILNIENYDSKSTNLLISKNNLQQIDPQILIDALNDENDKENIKLSTNNLYCETNSSRFNSRRPSDLKWSEASRSQEILSHIDQYNKKSPSSYSVNNCKVLNSFSELNDPNCIDSFEESLFQTPNSIPNSELYSSFDDNEIINNILPSIEYKSSINLKSNSIKEINNDCQSKSSESVMFKCRQTILALNPDKKIGQQICVKLENDSFVVKTNNKIGKSKHTPIVIKTTPLENCSPTFDPSGEIQGVKNVGIVRV